MSLPVSNGLKGHPPPPSAVFLPFRKASCTFSGSCFFPHSVQWVGDCTFSFYPPRGVGQLVGPFFFWFQCRPLPCDSDRSDLVQSGTFFFFFLFCFGIFSFSPLPRFSRTVWAWRFSRVLTRPFFFSSPFSASTPKCRVWFDTPTSVETLLYLSFFYLEGRHLPPLFF